ncbi:MAG: RHS domain-containing protein, partial [Deltaproteobacteria bacterium]|nr:RHS domain-containing protein [Deltaproteobacteria bacterium]
PVGEGGLTVYEYEGNRLTAMENGQRRAFTYDANGNTLSDGIRSYEYNQNNRLARVTQGEELLAEYAYDGLSRRVRKVAQGTTTYYHYDLEGNLIAETGPNGDPIRDIIYRDGERIAMKVYGAQAGIYYFLNDHLGTPRMLVNADGRIVWQAAYLPFGETVLIKEEIQNPFRFPGQYFDEETGLHYNYHRYYDPRTGRYLRPDPIGLIGGINLYIFRK